MKDADNNIFCDECGLALGNYESTTDRHYCTSCSFFIDPVAEQFADEMAKIILKGKKKHRKKRQHIIILKFPDKDFDKALEIYRNHPEGLFTRGRLLEYYNGIVIERVCKNCYGGGCEVCGFEGFYKIWEYKDKLEKKESD